MDKLAVVIVAGILLSGKKGLIIKDNHKRMINQHRFNRPLSLLGHV